MCFARAVLRTVLKMATAVPDAQDWHGAVVNNARRMHSGASVTEESGVCGSRSIQLVIHAKCQHLMALVDSFRRDWCERRRRGGEAGARRAEIDVFVPTYDRPFACQGMLDAPPIVQPHRSTLVEATWVGAAPAKLRSNVL
jgi:hypothetical protein